MAAGYDIMPFAKNPVERFHTRYRIDPASGCWIWQPSRPGADKSWSHKRFYPQIRVAAYQTMRASHFALELAGRPLQPGQIACHHCDNHLCVNPEHLFAGSYGDNTRDAIAKGRFPQNRALHGPFDWTGKKHSDATRKKMRESALERQKLRRKLGLGRAGKLPL